MSQRLMDGGPKTAEKQILKRINFHSIFKEAIEAIFCLFYNQAFEIKNLFNFTGS